MRYIPNTTETMVLVPERRLVQVQMRDEAGQCVAKIDLTEDGVRSWIDQLTLRLIELEVLGFGDDEAAQGDGQ